MTDKKVYAAISAVAKEMAATGISKDRRNQQQGFNFRGIDQVYNALAPALVTHGLLILPRITERTVTERTTQKGGTLFYVVVKADFDFVSTEDSSVHTVTTYGEAMDSGDKATNKAMSIAYKYAAFQAFCIPTEETAIDADAEVHQVAPQDAEAALREFGDKASLSQSLAELQGAYKEVWPKLGGVKSYEDRAAETYKTRGRELQKKAA
ncbi:MAG: ERF family protein [Enterobacteriaceae bacterium]|nr:ERF family protein [Enterobacteriaceae bacterium]